MPGGVEGGVDPVLRVYGLDGLNVIKSGRPGPSENKRLVTRSYKGLVNNLIPFNTKSCDALSLSLSLQCTAAALLLYAKRRRVCSRRVGG